MAGRPKGSSNKNKDRILRLLQEVYGDDFNPIMKMADIAADTNNEPSLRLQGWKEVAQYVYPKLKALEVSGSDDSPIRIMSIDYKDA